MILTGCHRLEGMQWMFACLCKAGEGAQVADMNASS